MAAMEPLARTWRRRELTACGIGQSQLHRPGRRRRLVARTVILADRHPPTLSVACMLLSSARRPQTYRDGACQARARLDSDTAASKGSEELEAKLHL